LRKMKRWKLGENLKVRVPGDPSVMIELKILSVETFCFGGLRQRVRIETRWEDERRPNFDTGKRRLRCLKTMGERLGKRQRLPRRQRIS